MSTGCPYKWTGILALVFLEICDLIRDISNIKNDQITLEAELFSLDGKERFYHKASKDIESAEILGLEVGEILKKESKNSYKK